MSELVLLELSKQFWFNLQIVKSWYEHKKFESQKEAFDFFESNKNTINAKPFVKWVWGKRQILAQLQNLFPKKYNNYHEPFLGWWAVFFSLQKKQSFLSDVNAELINTYEVIKKHPKKLIKFLKTCEHNKEFYQKIRAWDRSEDWQKSFSDIERAWRFIYLNRTCFNWLYRVNSKWQFNVPMGAYKNPDFIQEENILNTSKLLNETKAIIKF